MKWKLTRIEQTWINHPKCGNVIKITPNRIWTESVSYLPGENSIGPDFWVIEPNHQPWEMKTPFFRFFYSLFYNSFSFFIYLSIWSIDYSAHDLNPAEGHLVKSHFFFILLSSFWIWWLFSNFWIIFWFYFLTKRATTDEWIIVVNLEIRKKYFRFYKFLKEKVSW